MVKQRSYRSNLRQRQAADTRLRIRKAARKLFEEQGFAATTVGQIAHKANVATPTVYATFGSKSGIVAAMLQELEESVGIPEGLGRLFAEQDPHRQLEAYVAGHCGLFESGADVLRAAVECAHTDASALAEQGNARRRQLLDQLTRRWSEQGALTNGLTQQSAAEQMWLLTTVESYLTALDALGWSCAQYEQWLLALLRDRILVPET